METNHSGPIVYLKLEEKKRKIITPLLKLEAQKPPGTFFFFLHQYREHCTMQDMSFPTAYVATLLDLLLQNFSRIFSNCENNSNFDTVFVGAKLAKNIMSLNFR